MREIIIYLISGGLTTVINWAVYWVCYQVMGIPNVAAQIISWIAAVIVAYVTNKLWVFESRSWSSKVVVSEAAKFLGARVGTGILETVCMWIGVDVLGFSGNKAMLVKIVVSVAVVILNYVFSKLLIFKGEKS